MTHLRLQRVSRARISRPAFLPILATALCFFETAARGADPNAARAPAADAAVHPALDIALFASEPDVVDPVALTFDEDGRMYVVEMRDYPYGIGPDRRSGGTIRMLEDTNGDARADRSTLFAQGLSFPTSVAPWNGGVLVTAPPEVLFLKDTDGDGKADVREVMLKGFTLGVTDSNVNGLRWGLDNRVHGANGGNGGNIISGRKPGAPIPIRDQDFSFDPATGDFDATFRSSEGFGLVFDDWGRSFVTYNINHIQHRVLPTRYLHRFAGLPPIENTLSISDHGEMSRIYPISKAETRPNHPEQSGHFSAAGGMGFIGAAYPGDLSGSILVCDVVGNLVHRDVLIEDGPSFIARRSILEQRSEFFASRDNACRPIGVELGPDGALYLIDMQRDVIEHPDYIPERVRQKLNLRAGEDRGRIYRLTPKGGMPSRKPALSRARTSELIEALSNPSQWWRTTAQRLLFERQDKAAIPILKKLAATSAAPLGRLHALWTLQGLRALGEADVLRGLVDSHPGIRENSLLLAESFLPGSAELQTAILGLAEDPTPRVRFQTALTLGNFEHPRTSAALRRILRWDHANRWSRVAVFSSLRGGEGDLFRELLGDPGFRLPVTEAKVDLISELADLIGARSEREGSKGIASAISAVDFDASHEEKYQIAALKGLQSGLSRSSFVLPADTSLTKALEKSSAGRSPAVLEAAWRLARTLKLPETETQRGALAQAQQAARDNTRSEPDRIENIRLLVLGNYGAVSTALFDLLAGIQSSSIQGAAIEALRQFDEPEIGRKLLDRWPSIRPGVRRAVIDLLLHRRAYHEPLITAIEGGKVKLGELNLDLEQRRLLLLQSSPDVKARASKLFGDDEYGDRKGLVEEWLTKLPPSGNATLGRAVFEKTCAQCHIAGGLGHSVGPDMSDMSHRSVEDLLSNILDPNMALNAAYVSSNLELESGELVSGIVQSESGEAITVLQAQGIKRVIARKGIRQIEVSGISLMPEGLESGLTPADMRDLIAFLQEKR